MREMVALKVRIRLGDRGAVYPEFNKLGVVRRSGQDWSNWIDNNGSGWLYDCCGHKEEGADSPIGMQWGMLLVPEEFAEEAVRLFSECEIISEDEACEFYEHKHNIRCPRLTRDPEVLQGLLSEIQLLERLIDLSSGDAKQQYRQWLDAAVEDAGKSVDASHPQPGVSEVRGRTFAEFKQQRQIKLRRKP